MHELNVDEKVSQIIESKDEKYTQKRMVEDLKPWEGVSNRKQIWVYLSLRNAYHTHTSIYIYALLL